LNPMVHMGQTSIIMLILLGMAWGETPVNRARLRHSLSSALVSFAGPFSNLLLLTVCVWLMLLLSQAGLSTPLMNAAFGFFYQAAMLNGFLFLLNMLPLPPLDGFAVLETFFPSLRHYAISLSQYGYLILVLLFLFFGLGGHLMQIARLMVEEVASLSNEILQTL
jgi:Zn-dependent protease